MSARNLPALEQLADFRLERPRLSWRKDRWTNPDAIDKRFFTPDDVLYRRREVWEGKGVFVWPKDDFAVSLAFAEAGR